MGKDLTKSDEPEVLRDSFSCTWTHPKVYREVAFEIEGKG